MKYHMALMNKTPSGLTAQQLKLPSHHFALVSKNWILYVRFFLKEIQNNEH